MFVITFDTDWAPGFVVEYCASILNDYGFRATYFCTGQYPELSMSNMEIALHPNLMPDSTHGSDERTALLNLKTELPSVQGVRTHRLYWHSNLYSLFKDADLTYDSSLLMPLQPYLKPHEFGSLVRVPIWWSEKVHYDKGYSLNEFNFSELKYQGLKVLLFHPIHIYLNTNNIDHINKIICSFRSLKNMTKNKLDKFRNDGIGVETLFYCCIDYIKKNQSFYPTINEYLLNCYNNKNE